MNRNLKYASITAAIVMAVLAIGAVATVGLVAPALAQGNMSSGGNMTNATGGNMTNSSSSGGGGGG